MTYLPHLVVSVVLLTGAVSWPAPPWHHPLYLANQGYWPQRVPVQIRNESTQAVAGEVVTVSVSALAGLPVESLRVCRADGVELLFDLCDESGRSKHTGALADRDALFLPAECPARSSTTLYVYAGNNRAGAVPEFLPAGLHNGGFEFGTEPPEAWEPASTDQQHVLTWEQSEGRAGGRCVRAEVAAGATAQWVQWQQGNLRVVPGRTYRLSAWVRAENVAGQAGWYVHVDGDKPQLVNKTLSAGSGTYDWKQLSTEFVAPASARTAIIGTVLYGTGRAWFDDAEFICLDGPSNLVASAGPLEQLRLDPGPPPAPDHNLAGQNRVAVRVRNFSEQPAEQALVRVNLRPALARLRGVAPGSRVQVTSPDNRELAPCRLGPGADWLYTAPLPARSERLFQIRFGSLAQTTSEPTTTDEERLLTTPANLAANPSFESGADSPEFWLKPASGGANQVSAGFSTDARFGRRSLELTLTRNTRADWVGWLSPDIPVRPGSTYLFSGWLKAVGLKSSATLHAHFHNRSGALTTSGAMVSTQPHVSGDSDWVQSLAFIQAPPDAATIRLHLTMNTSGTLRHDGLVLCEVLEGAVEHVQAPSTGQAGADMHLWEVNPLIKVFPDTPPQASPATLKLELGRNEYEPLQLALRAPPGDPLRGVEVSVTSLRNEAGALLPPVRIERVECVPVDHPSGSYSTDVPDWCRKVPRGSGATDGWAGSWPDPLLPNTRFDVPSDHTQPLWLTVRAPHDAAPGLYRAELSIRAAGRKNQTWPLSVRVFPFRLPDKTKLKAIFDFRRGPGGWLGPDAKEPDQYRKWLRFIAEHRLGIDAIEPPPQFAYQGGKVTMDTTAFDETARFCFDELGLSASYTPWFFYMFGWAYPPKKLFGLEPFTPEWNDAFTQAYKLFTDHLRAKGWHDRFVYYLSDEPHFNHEFVLEQMRTLCALIHAVDARIPIYSSTWRHCPAWDDSLDLWGVGQYGCFPVTEMERLHNTGKQIWFTCDGQMATDTPYLATERMLPYYCFKYGAGGFEFWGLSWWTADPWKRGWHDYIRQSDEGQRYYWIRYPNGDGYLAYPGQPVGLDGPVSTIRLEQVREGLEDYEVMTMLADLVEKAKQSGRPAAAGQAALAMAKDLVNIPNAGGLRSTEILPNPDRLPEIRRALNAALADLIE